MEINIPVEIKIELGKDFEQKYKKAIEKSIQFTHKRIQNNIPTASGKTRNALKYSIDYNKGEARIGWSEGSKEEMIGSVLEAGSGERGAQGGSYVLSGKSAPAYKPRFGGSRPDYTNPIKPKYGKYMSFKGSKGPVFMKEFKGHIAKYSFSDGVAEAMRFLPIVIENELKK